MDDLKLFLEESYEKYNNIAFIEDDPISIPHLFDSKKDIEIIGFIVAVISWGNRKSIIKNGHLLVDIMGNQPYQFIINASESELREIKFVHRTFNQNDLRFFILAFREFYQQNKSLEKYFLKGETTQIRISNFRDAMLKTPHETRSEKHLSNPLKNSAAKRINMFLRWMVRNDNRGVDFGLWNSFGMENLMIPLDVHTGNIARKLGLLKRHQNDWKALEELMVALRKFDSKDPCKYDFSLFGLGVNKDLEF